jgi:hypothetical protein
MTTTPVRAAARQRRRHQIAESLLVPGQTPPSVASAWTVDDVTEDTPPTAIPQSPELLQELRAMLEDDDTAEHDPTLQPPSAAPRPRGPRVIPAPSQRLEVKPAEAPAAAPPAWLIWGGLLAILALVTALAAG